MNNLKYSSSPYLQQHADNPVHWQEWSPEVLKNAQEENKPLIISIGYAACHWCHVMEHESFSDQEVADFMNDNFVCIKVDREERPDVDRIYMDAVQIISGQGGWPLNAFAMPDGRPFFAGTYFNKARWMEVLAKISDLYKNDYDKVVDYANQLTAGLNSNPFDKNLSSTYTEFSKEDYNSLFNSWKSQIDYKDGGFNRAPKFPLPTAWEFLLQYNYLTKDKEALNAVEITLDEMAKGGIYDQIGGGFARYSVDAYWKVPHFEKMLYDNAQLVSLYSHAYQITKKVRYAEIVKQTLQFVERELSSTEFGFYSSLNADSEGEEGKFYVWTYDEINSIIDIENKELIIEYYQITKAGNWEHGNNILLPVSSKEDFAIKHNISLLQLNSILERADNKLFSLRSTRIPPSTDNKVLTAWNALMLKAYVDAYKAISDEKILKTAIKNAEFLENTMLKADGSLFRNYMNGKASINGFHDDYASLSDAYLSLYSVTFNEHWINLSKNLADYCISHFYDEKNGMFYYTSNVAESLIARKYEITDNVIPSSNSIMAGVLLKLGHYYDDQNYLDIVSKMVKHTTDDVKKSGPWYANWAQTLGLIAFNPYEVAIVGKNAISESHKMQSEYLPTSLFLGGNIENLPLLKGKISNGITMIYVCRNKTCKMPVENSMEALKLIK